MHWRWAWGTDAPYRLQVFRLCHWPPGHWSLLTGRQTRVTVAGKAKHFIVCFLLSVAVDVSVGVGAQ